LEQIPFWIGFAFSDHGPLGKLSQSASCLVGFGVRFYGALRHSLDSPDLVLMPGFPMALARASASFNEQYKSEPNVV
jgi:hypothetical protein